MKIAIRSATAALLCLAIGAAPAVARYFNFNANGSLVLVGNPSGYSQYERAVRSEHVRHGRPAHQSQRARPSLAGLDHAAVTDLQTGSWSRSPPPDNPTAAHGPAPTIVRVTPRADGFDWGDAGIGAAGGLALSAIALGVGLAVSEHRARRTRHSTF